MDDRGQQEESSIGTFSGCGLLNKYGYLGIDLTFLIWLVERPVTRAS